MNPAVAPDSGASPPLPPGVRRFGWISFANDMASEMVTPLVPLLLVGPLGASAAVVGLVEGLAEAACQGLKWVAGRWSDRKGGHLGQTLAGYALSNFVRPCIGLAATPFQLLALRTFDRVGKGLRTAPRDALLAHAVAPEHRARAFGYQRSLDHLGAALGPLLAFAMLRSGASLQATVLWSGVPALLTLALFWGFAPARPPLDQGTATLGWYDLDATGRKLVAAAALLSFSNLPEALLVVWLHELGYDASDVVLVWAAAHVAKTLIAYPAGALADRLGRRAVVLGGWMTRGTLLAIGAIWPPSGVGVLLGFVAYGAALAISEGAERALIAAAAPPARRGAAFGAYAALPGLAALPGGVAFGTAWVALGSHGAFALGAGAAALASAALLLGQRQRGA